MKSWSLVEVVLDHVAEDDSLSLSGGVSLEEMKGGGGAVVLDRELSNPWLHFHLSRPWFGCPSLYRVQCTPLQRISLVVAN